MIGYVTLGTNNKERAEKFYDELMKEIGAGRVLETEQFTAYSTSMEVTGFSITKPYNEEPATVGNGSMIALKVDTEEQVQQVYKKAIELGGSDEGEPGQRGDTGFYAAYFRDLDGHKLNVFTFIK